jgi:formate dehydrogenase subunit gamma
MNIYVIGMLTADAAPDIRMHQDSRNRHRVPWDKEVGLTRIRECLDREGPLLPILHALQDEFGYIEESAEPLIAEALNISRAEVHGVVTFYHDFRREPAGRHVLRLCRAEACQAAGGDPLALRAEARLGVRLGETAADGSVTLEPVYCLGLCAVAPSAMLDGRVVARLDEGRLDALLAEAQQ